VKRDWDLIREILLAIEARCDGGAINQAELDITAAGAQAVSYHLALLHEAGLIDAIDVGSHDGDDFLVRRLTWDGHEFLDAARDETTWKQAKAVVAQKTGSLSFGVLKALLVKLATDLLMGGVG